MSEYTITSDTPVYCWTCGNVEKWKDAHLDYSGYEDDFLPYCSKCGSRSYLEKKPRPIERPDWLGKRWREEKKVKK